jgi:hypothetical protein
VLGPEGIVHIGEPDVVYETVDGMQIGDAVINAKPYTEPDLEQVRMEAYEEGYKTAKIQCGIQAEKDMREVGKRHYQRGLSDAWKAVRKIIKMPEGDLLNIFTECYSAVCTALQVILKYDASECIEKIQAYEQEKAEIQVGDEVEGDEDGQRGVVIDSRFENSQVAVLTGNSKVYSWWSKCAIHKTGRHFPEIAAVLEKMRGEQDG